VVYYGSADRGRFTQTNALAAKLRPHGGIAPGEVIMTIVDPRPLQLRIDVPEAEIRQVKPGTAVTATATAYPDVTFRGVVESVASVPTTPGQFEAIITLKDNAEGPAVMPGMAASIKLAAYDNPDAIVAPAKAVFQHGEQRIVYIRTDAGHEKRAVKVGRTAGDKLEILEGLSPGDTILLAEPDA
jgi:RND family efflux transporter MFP subunit